MRERMTALIAIGLLLVLIAASYWYAVKSSYGNLRYLASENSPDFIATNATIVSFDADGKAKMKATAEEVKHYSDDRVTMIKPVFTSVSPDAPISQVSSNSGSSEDGGASVLLTGNVVATRTADAKSDGLKLETESMTVYPDTQQMETEDFVRITSGRNIATGTGMKADNLDRTVEIKSRVKTTYHPQEGVNLLPATR